MAPCRPGWRVLASVLPALRLRRLHRTAGLQKSLQQLRHRLPARRLLRLSGTRIALAPPLRPDADLTVLDVTKYFGETTGGVRTYLLEKAAYVAPRDTLSHVMIVPGAASSVTDAPGSRTYRIRGRRIPTQAPYRFLHDTGAIREIITHERPSLIEIGSPFVVPWTVHRAARRSGIPLAWFYHGNVPRLISQHPGHDGVLRSVGHNLAWRYVRRVSRLMRATLVASDFVAADLAREGIENVVRVPLGVDLGRFTPARRASRAAIRARHHLPDGPLAMFCGRFAREKHLDVLIRAWPEVERRTGARLVLVGGGPSAAWLRAQPGAERVVWLPFERDRDALANLVAAADLYVAPGPAETFGLAALEALASGVPVLSVDSGGVPELVTRSGAGATYPIGDRAALADQAAALFQQDLPALGARGRSYAEREHAWPAVFDRIFAAYRTLIG
ncbi:MAG: glycosyltransferase [Gemmatimonadota bacterium]